MGKSIPFQEPGGQFCFCLPNMFSVSFSNLPTSAQSSERIYKALRKLNPTMQVPHFSPSELNALALVSSDFTSHKKQPHHFKKYDMFAESVDQEELEFMQEVYELLATMGPEEEEEDDKEQEETKDKVNDFFHVLLEDDVQEDQDNDPILAYDMTYVGDAFGTLDAPSFEF